MNESNELTELTERLRRMTEASERFERAYQKMTADALVLAGRMAGALKYVSEHPEHATRLAPTYRALADEFVTSVSEMMTTVTVAKSSVSSM